MKLNKRLRYGFTIVEILVVITVIGILVTITAISYSGLSGKAIANSLQSDLVNASDYLRIDKTQSSTGVFPATLAAANGGDGVPASKDTTYQYTVNNTNTPKTFCVTATKSGQSYNINQEGVPFAGPCPVLWLDAAITTSYPGTGTTWNDLSGNGNNGTLNGGVTYNSANGGSLVFDGVNGYVQTPISGTFPTLSISFWGYFDDATLNTKSRNESAFGDWTSNNIHFGTRWSVGMHWNVDGSSWVEIQNTNLVYGWNQYTLTYDTNTNQKLVFINNKLSSTESTSGPIVIGNFKIGVATGLNAYYRGKIGNFNFYNRALSQTEIQQNFNALRGRYGV